MDMSRIRTNYGLPRLLAVTAAVAYGIFAIGVAVARRDRVAMPGAAVTLAIYLTLGVFIVRGHAWARWVMFTLTALTALTCLVGAFIPTSGPPDARGTYLILGSSA